MQPLALGVAVLAVGKVVNLRTGAKERAGGIELLAPTNPRLSWQNEQSSERSVQQVGRRRRVPL